LKRVIFLSLSIVLLLILIPSCITVQPPATLITPPSGMAPVIGTFTSGPSTINPGGTSNLVWNVTGANSVSIDHGIGLVNAWGSMAISPATSTVYTLSATNSVGTVTSSAVTTVNPTQVLPAPVLSPTISSGALLVTGIVISVDPNVYTGTCPTTVNFSATITANGPGTITYRWERSDGTVSPVQSSTFASAGTQMVSTTWTRGGGTGWQLLHILTPRDAVSNQIGFTLTCVP
jgi:hypothetical protein